jgi:Mg-chelatase subunit ChlD
MMIFYVTLVPEILFNYHLNLKKMRVSRMTKEQKLEALGKLKKANKERKILLAQKAGYKTVEGYLKALGGEVKKPTATKKPEVKKVSKDESEKTDYVIAFDTTGSMGGYIRDVKIHVSSLIPELFSNSEDLMMKIVAFGDYSDMENEKNGVFGKAFQTSQLTDNQNDLINFVNTARNTGGGDAEEFYELVIKKIVEETPWRKNSKRVILLIADDNPHNVGYRSRGGIIYKIDWRQEARKAAGMGIQIDTINCGSTGNKFRKELSEVTDGVNIDFKSQSKTTELIKATTYARSSKESFTKSMSMAMSSGDDELIGLYKKINETL